MTLEHFINNVIKDELGIMINTPRLKYLSFIVMSSAIEFLGACIDNDNRDFHVSGLSSSRFEKAIDEIPALIKYRKNKKILYEELRCGLSHVALPKSKIELTERNDQVCGKMHMQIQVLINRTHPRRLILVCEDLYDDISHAATEVIERLKLGRDHHKVYESFMATDIRIAETS